MIANYLATHITDQVFAVPRSHSSAEILVAIYAYAVQIYADFSGYTDMAIGLALLLGFRFPQNFDSPYAAVSLQDFWRRWHMTLSRWLRDYLYIPLGGNRKGRARTYRQPDDHDAPRRALARRVVDVRRLGRDPRHRARPRALAARPAGLRRPEAEPRRDLGATADHLQRRLLRLDLLPLRLDAPGLGDDHRPLHRLGGASPLVTAGVLIWIVVGIACQYLPSQLPRS